jgi:disulfide bond formation protein DsbB
MSLLDALLRRWPLAAFVVSALVLAIAHAFETFGGLRPCHMCLQQREVYWTALGISALALAASATRVGRRAPRIASLLLAIIFAYGAYLAGYQAGAEWKWWSEPATCEAAGGVSYAQLQALLAGARSIAPSCDKAAWVFLGLSMAGWNFLISLVLVVLSLAAALRQETRA